MLALSRILLRGIIQTFACSVLTLKGDIDIIFVNVAIEGGAVITFSQNFWENADLVFC